MQPSRKPLSLQRFPLRLGREDNGSFFSSIEIGQRKSSARFVILGEFEAFESWMAATFSLRVRLPNKGKPLPAQLSASQQALPIRDRGETETD
ncbi:MAG: hypothetical protein NTU79_04770 [Planctomycetota bacterium]|nr:hypothetical protein [Planctomycetota bacterium]